MYTNQERDIAAASIIGFCKDKKRKINTVEIGAGMPFSTSIFMIPGASAAIQSAWSPYDWALCRTTYEIPENQRAVGRETVETIANRLVTSEQIGVVISAQLGNDESTISHAWICAVGMEGPGYSTAIAHITVKHGTRPEMIASIGDHALEIFLRTFVSSKLKLMPYCDYLKIYRHLDAGSGDFTVDEFVDNVNNDAAIYYEGQEPRRLVDLFRSQPERLYLFKGSFNPPTIAHVNMLRRVSGTYGVRPVVVISTDTYGKGDVPPESLKSRIRMINTLGYGVLVIKMPKFYHAYSLLKKLGYNGTQVYMMGSDTINRVFDDEITTNIEDFLNHMGDSELIIFDRPKHEIGHKDSNRVFWLGEIPGAEMSSTQIRNAIGTIDKYLPAEIRGMVMDAFAPVDRN